MSAATLAASTSLTAGFPDALQQFLHKIEEQCTTDLRAARDLHGLKSDLVSRWRIATSEGRTSSTMLYEILQHGWKEWERIIA